MSEGKKLYSAVEVAEMLGCSTETVWRMARRRELPFVKLGARWYLPAAAFEAHLEKLAGGGCVCE